MTSSPSTKERYFQRLSPSQRVQHFVMIFSFFLLAITGLPVRYPSSPISSAVISLLGGFAMRALLHRIAAVIMIGITGYHVLWTAFTKEGFRDFLAFMPKFRDVHDVIHMMKYYFGLAANKPKFDRYNYIEKFEYFALGWGTVVMVVTGFMLWFESQAMMVFPKWALDVAKVVHSYEALLAFLSIIIWHFYHVHFNPEVFPMSNTWLTGTISEHEMMEHHPLEYERITRSEHKVKETVEAGVES